MAGKTFPGIGDLEDESPPGDPADPADSGAGNSRPFYSGPTVVDDVKVEEGLKKLRSLDAPLGTLTGISKAVVDAIESSPLRLTPEIPALAQPTPPQVVAHQMRETAVGRNVVGPTVGRQEIPPPFDDRALRGTLFGHSIHAPEFALPAPEEPPPPGALALLDRGAPTTTVAVYQPHPTTPPEAEPFQRSNRYRDTPLTPISVDEAPSRKKFITRVAIGAIAIVAVVAAALFLTRDDSDGSSSSGTASAGRAQVPPSAPATTPRAATPPTAAPTATPSAAPASPAAPPAAAPPVAAARESEPGPMPATEPTATHPSPSATRAAARQTDPSPEPAAEDPASASRPHHTRAASGHADRHHAAPEGDKTSDTENPPAKPARSGKRAPEDDPDATMAPSIE